MSYGGFGQRMVLHREPAWHNNGIVTLAPMTAEEAVLAGGMDYSIERWPLYLPDPADPGEYVLMPEYRAVIRGTQGSDSEKVLAVRPTDFNTYDGPLEVARLWDEQVKQPIETVGALGDGDIFFITAELPASVIAGDEHKNYIMADCNFAGADSCYVRNTKVRVVCMNTYAFARQTSLETIRINHKGDIRAQLRDGLETIWESAVIRSKEQDEALALLAGKRMEPDPFAELLETCYPEPRPPLQRKDEDVAMHRLRVKRFEQGLAKCLARRNAVRALFSGDRPARSPEAFTDACKGTLYGALNAVTEEVDWNTPRSENRRARSISEVSGEKAAIKARASEFLLQLA